MKKVCYIFRDQRSGNFSIEELFKRIILQLDGRVQTERFFCQTSKIETLQAISKLKSDLFHITGDVNYVSMALPKHKTLITVHDIGHFENTLKGWKKQVYRKLWMDFPFSKAKHLTAISHFTKSRLVETLNIDPEKITVVHNPRPDFKPAPYPELNGFFNIVQIGGGRNKNINNLIEAVRGIDGVRLLLVRRFDQALEQKMNDLGIVHEWHSLLNYEEVEKMYAKSHALFFASDYEGFGVPILEAQCVGRPVITSNIASMPEVAGDGALSVDHKSVAEIKNAIMKLMADEQLRNELIDKGFLNKEKFGIENTCEGYLSVYRGFFGF